MFFNKNKKKTKRSKLVPKPKPCPSFPRAPSLQPLFAVTDRSCFFELGVRRLCLLSSAAVSFTFARRSPLEFTRRSPFEFAFAFVWKPRCSASNSATNPRAPPSRRTALFCRLRNSLRYIRIKKEDYFNGLASPHPDLNHFSLSLSHTSTGTHSSGISLTVTGLPPAALTRLLAASHCLRLCFCALCLLCLWLSADGLL
ncbi:uncharacterized protein LOC107619119 isoform X2 [Arachis ipaensis]|uniref:uncharacterized protein LOC107619119 isoform X2 n=1 Tax=Arachis ipaensis TaxID=130454 RepID=UPI000A2B3A2C|nr:uncharacterized protein LOC107619119 isoform X2 [Arachis ipaensis]